MIARMETNAASSPLLALLGSAETIWPMRPRTTPPPRAAGSDTNAPNAAAPRVSINRYGPRVATLKLGWVGACNTAEMADSAPASAQVIRLTRVTEIPQSRAVSGLLAAARICLPSDE